MQRLISKVKCQEVGLLYGTIVGQYRQRGLNADAFANLYPPSLVTEGSLRDLHTADVVLYCKRCS